MNTLDFLNAAAAIVSSRDELAATLVRVLEELYAVRDDLTGKEIAACKASVDATNNGLACHESGKHEAYLHSRCEVESILWPLEKELRAKELWHGRRGGNLSYGKPRD